MKIRITASAYADIEKAAEFYARQSCGLGKSFQDSIFSDIDSLQFYAGIHPKYYSRYRLLAHKFPYAIYYDISADSVVVIAVLDCRREPEWIEGRL